MPKKTIQKLMPDHQKIKTNKHLKIFGSLLHNPHLWHLTRKSVAKSFAIGLFFAFMPIPFQMVFAALLSIIVHANLPIAVALVWISNPLTMPIIFYGCYLVGTLLLNVPEQEFAFEASWQWVIDSLSTIGPAFLLGCLFCGAVFAIIGYFGIQGLWRYSVAKEWKQRKQK